MTTTTVTISFIKPSDDEQSAEIGDQQQQQVEQANGNVKEDKEDTKVLPTLPQAKKDPNIAEEDKTEDDKSGKSTEEDDEG